LTNYEETNTISFKHCFSCVEKNFKISLFHHVCAAECIL